MYMCRPQVPLYPQYVIVKPGYQEKHVSLIAQRLAPFTYQHVLKQDS